MKVYVVGGAVRDRVMGIQPKDLDYVIVGATKADVEELQAKGFQLVGADFPVFLSPEGDEYAMARRERKVAPGYHGFEVDFGPDVTLEDDLGRRDLTMNAMAVPVEHWDSADWEDHIVDPFDGMRDIDSQILRHTTEAFKEDPVRVLRLARFAARYGSQWDVAKETIELCHEMALNGELKSLVPERVWKEFSRALADGGRPHSSLFGSEARIAVFFDVLRECDAMRDVFPGAGLLPPAFFTDLFGVGGYPPVTTDAARIMLTYFENSGDEHEDFARVAYLMRFTKETMAALKPPSKSIEAHQRLALATPLLAMLMGDLMMSKYVRVGGFTGTDMLTLVKTMRMRQMGAPTAVAAFVFDAFSALMGRAPGITRSLPMVAWTMRDLFNQVQRFFEETNFDLLAAQAKQVTKNIGPWMDEFMVSEFDMMVAAARRTAA